MSHAISVSAGKPFGLKRVCQVLEFPRSTIYAVRARESANVTPMVGRRRGPKPKMPDAGVGQNQRFSRYTGERNGPGENLRIS